MADKTKTIKTATDKELDELLIRLRKENELQNLIGDLKRRSIVSSPFNSISYDCPEVSTEVPIESLYHKVNETLSHYGVLGMKWGVRKRSSKNKSSTSLKKSTSFNKTEDLKKKIKLRDSDEVTLLKRKSTASLSNDELKKITTRMSLEQKYRELSPTKKDKMRKFAGDVSREIAKNFVVKTAGAKLDQAFGLSKDKSKGKTP